MRASMLSLPVVSRCLRETLYAVFGGFGKNAIPLIVTNSRTLYTDPLNNQHIGKNDILYITEGSENWRLLKGWRFCQNIKNNL